MPILPSTPADIPQIHEIINDAATAYKGIIPPDRWHEPYMSLPELHSQIADGVNSTSTSKTLPLSPPHRRHRHPQPHPQFPHIMGVMGIQHKSDVTLIRHAYVRTVHRNKGIGSLLLTHLTTLTTKPILIGTWAAATQAIDFYKKHGFHLVTPHQKELLLRKYWSIPLRQIETSVVLSNQP
ncbi:GNAT family N-acetyltransferase [Puia sp. P3]|uniref:GNAT family N-acetyltransferase n=1 Tax=Puia sp. P3 TaxID=3423952 RepID=UPI003D66A900